MTRDQQWTRNISKKIKSARTPVTPAVVNNDALENFKRRAEGLGLIIHAQQPKRAGKKKGGKK